MRIAPAPPRAPATGARGAWGTWREASGDQGLQRCSRLAVAVSSYFYLNNHPSSVYVKTADLTICAAAQARKMTSVGLGGLTQTCVDPGRPKS